MTNYKCTFKAVKEGKRLNMPYSPIIKAKDEQEAKAICICYIQMNFTSYKFKDIAEMIRTIKISVAPKPKFKVGDTVYMRKYDYNINGKGYHIGEEKIRYAHIDFYPYRYCIEGDKITIGGEVEADLFKTREEGEKAIKAEGF